MTPEHETRYQELEAYVAGLSEEAHAKQAAKAQAHEGAVFDLIRAGDAVAFYVAVKANPAVLESQDENGMTPLHWTAVDKSGLMQDIATSTPRKAPWIRDNHGRLPLDVMREMTNHGLADKLARLTYPQLFQHEKDGPVALEKVRHLRGNTKTLGGQIHAQSMAWNVAPSLYYPD